MLVLSRKRGQRLVIGDSVVVTVVQLKGGSVRLGFETPAQVRILRGELLDRAAREAAPQHAVPGAER